MKRWLFLPGCAGVAASLVLLWQSHAGGRSGHTPEKAVPASARGSVLGVEAFMRGVDRYRGSVVVEGVVSAVFPERETLLLIDTREFQECGVTSCARLQLPVRWRGTMPSVRETVRVHGQVEDRDGKLLFVARTLKLAEAKPGGKR